MPLILLKTLKNTLFIIFSEKKSIVAIFSVFCLLFDENNEIRRKSYKKLTFSVKRNFFREIAYITFFLNENKDGVS